MSKEKQSSADSTADTQETLKNKKKTAEAASTTEPGENKTDHTACEAKINNLESQLNERDAKIDKLNTIIANAASKARPGAPVIPAETFDFGNMKYQWQKATFMLPGDSKVHTAAEAQADENVLYRLIAIKGQKALKEMV